MDECSNQTQMLEINPKTEQSWGKVLHSEFQKAYFVNLKVFLEKEKQEAVIYPPNHLIFSAFDKTTFENLKVVILGQDPYHGEGQAHGLCFSVPPKVPLPPSLRNIFKELCSDIGCEIPESGHLEKWAEQGVLLINTTLTVRAGQAGSHQKKGWETFTDTVISKIAMQKENIVFILWGNYAQSKAKLIDESKHLIVKSVHPSPLSANRGGFFGTKPFSKTNAYLSSKGIKTLDWTLSN